MSWSVRISLDTEKNFENLHIFEVNKPDFIEFKEKLLETSGYISLDVYLVLNRICVTASWLSCLGNDLTKIFFFNIPR